jgi:signal transduction histidine kinase
MQNPPLDILKYRPFPELAGALRIRAEKILQRWSAAVRQILPAAEELTFTQLRDHLPHVLGQMAEALEADQAAATYELMDASQPHGVARFHQNFNVNELLIEYHVLRRIILEEVADKLGRPLQASEIIVLNLGIDTALRRGVVTFIAHQQQQLQAVTELQTRYLSFLSHDLRGGLNGAMLMIEVLKRDIASEPRFAETLGDLDVMRRSILDTVATMDRFLHAEQFRNGKVQVRLAQVDVNALLQELVSMASYQANDKGIAIQTELRAGCQVTSDRELLTLIFQNVLGNAIKYTSRGAVTIRTGRARTSDDDGGCRVSIGDQGPGIAQDKIKDLFVPFARGDTHGQPGVGLGLSIAKQAADLLGAAIQVESTVGSGATFHVDLPDKVVQAE